MKKFKLICSAIAALIVLALAGCDLNVPDSKKLIYADEIEIYTGSYNFSISGDFVVYFFPQFGNWKATTYIDDVLSGDEDEELISDNSWWGDGDKSTEAELADGSTVRIRVVCTDASANAVLVFEGYDSDKTYIDVDCANVKANGGADSGSMSGDAWTFEEDATYDFEITRKGNNLSFVLLQVFEE